MIFQVFGQSLLRNAVYKVSDPQMHQHSLLDSYSEPSPSSLAKLKFLLLKYSQFFKKNKKSENKFRIASS